MHDIAIVRYPNLTAKENVMNEATELEVVELGDAKQETKGFAIGDRIEENPILAYDRLF